MKGRWPEIAFGIPIASLIILIALRGWPFSPWSNQPVTPADWIGAIGSASAALGAVWIAVWNERNRKREARINGAIEIESSQATLEDMIDSIRSLIDRTSFAAEKARYSQRAVELAASRLNHTESMIPFPAEEHKRELASFNAEVSDRDNAMNEYRACADAIFDLGKLMEVIRYPIAQGFDHRFSRHIVAARNLLFEAARAIQRETSSDDPWHQPLRLSLSALESALATTTEATDYLSKL